MTKPVRKAFFNRLMHFIFDQLKLIGRHTGGLISGIEVYAYTDKHAPERKMIFPPYLQVLQAVIIENAVIHPFTGSALTVDIFVLLGISWYTGLETKVAVVFYVNGTSITARGTFSGMRAFLNTATFQRAAVFMGVFDRIIPPWTHFMASLAKRMSVLGESDIIRGIFRRFCPAVDVD